MPLSWNEIRDRAIAFSKEWESENSEKAEAKSFWDDFFNVFGITRRRIASFEAPVKKSDGKDGYIDLLWKGVLVVEHKSRGKDLDRACKQALDYFPGLKERDLPRYVLVSDFARFRLYDLDENTTHEFNLSELHQNTRLFGFIAGYQVRAFKPDDPVNVEAARQLGHLHDLLLESGYKGHPLEVLLVRLLFCLFAEDTGIFQQRQFREYLEQRTGEDGSDLGMHLAELFQALNTAIDGRQKTLDEQLMAFPHINGKLFEESIPLAAFNKAMRETLLDCGTIDWSKISPAIFGSLFQSIMDDKARREIGAHYTSETNIMKVLQPLFLDELHGEFERVKRNPKQLIEFQNKLANIRILDPACGCGNFLVVAYREIRLIEMDVLRALHKDKSGFLNVADIVHVNVDQFYGIEIEEFPAQIAQVALWLMDHQMNLRVSQEFGQYFARLPLVKSPTIVNGNALRMDWNDVLAASKCRYVLGNPPFIGYTHKNEQQKSDTKKVFGDVKGAGILDYVACWYRKATDYMAGKPTIVTAFVSTNSITQGEQVGIIWADLLKRGARIHFAHRTFQWSNEASGRAAVHCVIIGFALHDTPKKFLYEYEKLDGEPLRTRALNINPYLVDGATAILPARTQSPPNLPQIKKGSEPTDGGNLLLSDEERVELLKSEPDAEKWLRPFLQGNEFLNGITRWCLWLEGISPAELRKLPKVLQRVEAVKLMRLSSNTASTKALAATPTRFGGIREPSSEKYLALPKTSSERRIFLPIGYLDKSIVCGDALFFISDPSLYVLGVLSSSMHMAWVRAVAGRLESRYRYAPSVYNNFPWPEPNDKQKAAIEIAAQGVLDARAKFSKSTLADLYDPNTMPPELTKAHQVLDRAVDAAYGRTFDSEAKRVAFLFERYVEITSKMEQKPKGKKRAVSSETSAEPAGATELKMPPLTVKNPKRSRRPVMSRGRSTKKPTEGRGSARAGR